MNKEEIRAKFEKNVEYLSKNIPPDDIYIFTEQTIMAALFFMHKWTEWVDLVDECHKDPIARKWVNNILGLVHCRDNNVDINIDLDMKSLYPYE